MQASINLSRLGVRFPVCVLVFSLLVTIVSLVYSSRLKIQNDLTSLLPRSMESVQALDWLKENFGGIGHLILAVESTNPETTKLFAAEMVRRVERHPSVEYVDFYQPIDYFLERQWLFLDLDDLHEIERRVELTLQLEKRGVSPIFSKFVDLVPENELPDLSFKDIIGKYRRRFGLGVQGAVSSEDERFLVTRIKLRENPQNLDATKKILSDLKQIEGEIKKSDEFQRVSISYTGSYQKTIEQTDMIGREIAWVSAAVSGVLLLTLLLYFRQACAALFVAVTVAMGVLWTFGLAFVFVDHLNIITGFSAAILAGLGSDYGIYILTRYYQERNNGRGFSEARHLAFSMTAHATGLAMLTSAATFIALWASDFRLLFEFGLVGSLGLLLNYLAMMLILPAFLALEDRLKRGKVVSSVTALTFSRTVRLGFTARWGKIPIVLFLFFLAISLTSLPAQSKIYFEDGQIESRKLPSFQLSDRTNKMFQGSQNPTVLIVQGLDEERKSVRILESLLREKGRNELVYNQVLGLSSFVPEFQDEKKKSIRKIYETTGKIQGSALNQKQKLLDSLRSSLDVDTITHANLPREVKRFFGSPRHEDVFAVYLNPSFARTTSDSMRQYHEGIRYLKKATDLRFTAVDGTFISDDLLKLISSETPRGLGMALVCLFAVTLILVRPIRHALIHLGCLLGGLVLISGVLWILRIRLNVINIAVIPMILGTGIDCFFHLGHRLEENDPVEAISGKVPAIVISALTSIIGFGGLIFTSSSGLRSAGWVAVIGIAVMTFVCLYILPNLLSRAAKN